MKLLHSEWFPIDYSQNFFDHMNSQNFITIGSFYKVEVPGVIGGDPAYELIMIGVIFSKIQYETKRNK